MLLFVSIGFWDFVCMQIILLHWMKWHQTMSKQHCIKIKKSFSFFLPFSAGFSQVSSLFYCNHLVSTWKATYKKRIIWNGINGRTLGDRDPFVLITFWPFSLCCPSIHTICLGPYDSRFISGTSPLPTLYCWPIRLTHPQRGLASSMKPPWLWTVECLITIAVL